MTRLGSAVLVLALMAAVATGAQPINLQGPPGSGVMVADPAKQMISPYTLLYQAVQNKSGVLYGGTPPALKVLGLTEEQTKSVEAVTAEAKNEWTAFQKEARPVRSAEGGPAAHKEYFEKIRVKREELGAKYAARIAELLTAKQRELLKKMEDAAAKKAAADEKAREAWMKAQDESAQAFEKELGGALSDEQKARVKDLAIPSRFSAAPPAPVPVAPVKK